MIKKIMFIVCFAICLTNLEAQKFRFEYGVMYGLNIKPFKDSTLVRGSSNFSGLYNCTDSLTGVVRCLLGGDYGRVKVRGKIPKIYINLELLEPSKIGLDELLSKSNKNKQVEDDLDSLSLVRLALGLLERTYNFTVSEVIAMDEVWCLRVTDPSKLARYDNSRNPDERVSGPDHRVNWTATGRKFDDLCSIVSHISQVVVYDETNEPGLFDFEKPMIPFKTMQNFDALNTLLETHYGLHFVKRKQLEKLKIIEFK